MSPGAGQRGTSGDELSTLEALFHQAMAMPAGARDAWVDGVLAGDPRQAGLLKRMLEHAEAETRGVAQAIAGFAREAAIPRDRSGERIGRYRLIERIRHGGMAEVYRAARDDGEFEHEVALKVVRGDRVRAGLNALFAAERALMARLHHPHIIQLFDGGTTAQGEAWFVMELLDGQPLPAAIGAHRIGAEATLGHLIDLCAAVGHVHGQLVVHRDVKPENVLLCHTPKGLAVRLIDFGIAARLSAGLAGDEHDPGEAPSGGWHSPGYAAPEVRDGRPGGAAADIYSLGRLLLDCVPLLPPRYREELRAIGDKASREQPAERYPSAASIAEDLERMRRREAISLFRHRRLHVLGRAVQRHRWTAVVALAVVAAGAAWLWRESALRVEAEQAMARAEAERDRAGAMRDFLLDAFRSANPSLNGGKEPRVSELIADQLAQLQGAEQLDPDAHAQLLDSLAELLMHLDRRELAEQAYLQAIDLLEAQGRRGALPWALVMIRRGQLASRDARFDDAEALFAAAEEALERLPEDLGRARAASNLYSSWAASAQRRGRLDEAERLVRLGLATKPMLKAAGDPGGDDAAMRVTLGAIQSARGQLDAARDTFEAAYRDHRDAGRSDTFEHLALLGWLGITFDRLGRASEAEPYLVEAVALAERLFDQPNSRLSGSYANLGRLYLNQGRLAEAEPLLRRALAVSEAAGDAATPNHAARLDALGLLAWESERLAEAEQLHAEALALRRDTLGEDHPRTLSSRLALATVRAESGASAALLDEVEDLLATVGQAGFRAEVLLLAARLAAERGDRPRAERALAEATALLEAQDPAAPTTAPRRWLEARARLALGDRDAARAAFLDAATRFRASGRDRHPGHGRALLGAALLSPPGSDARKRAGEEARTVLRAQLQPPAASLERLDAL